MTESTEIGGPGSAPASSHRRCIEDPHAMLGELRRCRPVNIPAMPGSALRSREKASADVWEAPRFVMALAATLFIGGAAVLIGNGLLIFCVTVLFTVELFAFMTVGLLRDRGLRDREMLALPWIVLSGPCQRQRLSLILADRQKSGPRDRTLAAELLLHRMQ